MCPPSNRKAKPNIKRISKTLQQKNTKTPVHHFFLKKNNTIISYGQTSRFPSKWFPTPCQSLQQEQRCQRTFRQPCRPELARGAGSGGHPALTPGRDTELHLRRGCSHRCQDADSPAGHRPQLIVRQHKAATVEEKAEPADGRICNALAASSCLVFAFFFFFKGYYNCQHRIRADIHSG